jgi:iron complex outermembrane receptor protein
MTLRPTRIALLVTGLSIPSLVGLPHDAAAQSVNYGALEDLYGESVTTSVTGRAQKASEAPANVTIITADDIRRSGAHTIPDVLRFIPGIDVRQYSANQTDVSIQGYNQAFNPRVLVMVNGRQVYLDDYGYVAWSVIPVQLEEIRQIEVVKGPASALFGFNAASGVINIITYDPLYDSINAATVRIGSQALFQGSAVATAHLGDIAGFRLSVGGLKQNEFKPGVATPLHNPERGTFNIDGKVQAAPGVQVMLESSVATAQQMENAAFGTLFYDIYHTNSFKAGVIADTAWGTIAVNAYRNGMDFVANAGPLVVPVTNAVYVLQASDTLKLNPDNRVRLSLEYRNNAATSAGLLGGTIGYEVYSGSGMWDWQINPALTFTNSVRIDYLALNHSGKLIPGTGYTSAQYNNSTIAAPSFNSGVVYKVTDQDTVRLTAGRGLQVPSLIDFAISLPAGPLGPFAHAGSPTLQPTAVWNLELGYDRDIQAIDSTLHSSVYVQRNDRLLSAGGYNYPTFYPPATIASTSQNTGYSDAAGAEIGIRGHSADGFRWNASYAVEVVRDHTTLNKKALLSPQNYEDGTPTSTVIFGGGYTWDKLEIDGQGRWQSRYTDYALISSGLSPVHIQDYLTLMARIAYNVTDHVTLALVGQQINVPRLMETAGLPVERSVIASLNTHF